MKIAILYICTGKYNRFFHDFYMSSEKYFLVNDEKKYFVWTDDTTLGDSYTNVTTIFKECAGFPADSLFRFEIFLQAEKSLTKYDYIYFFNANTLFRDYITEDDILPDQTGLAMGRWCGRRERQHPMFYPYERNKKSLAYIAPYGKDYIYFMGGLNGGRTKEYLEMIKTLAQNIRVDYENGIIAKFHDESHINAYLRSHPCKVISSSLNQPEEVASPEVKIIFREKTRIDPYFNKGRKFTKMEKFKKGVNVFIDIIRWYLKV